MRRVQVVEAKASFSALLAAVEAGETVAITRHGRVVARLVPDAPRMAAEVFSPFWSVRDEIDLVAPPDPPPEPVDQP
ncbi:MAG: type II toxin-antitoxin system Phd/YefM family antitoxin [Gammaproteobacteria bacterium]